MMVCAVSMLMPNSSAINLSVCRRSCASICRTFSIISGILLVNGRAECGSSSCPIPPQSILASVADLVPAFVALSQSCLGFCLSMAGPNVAHPQSFPPFAKAFEPFVNTFFAHSFPPIHLNQHLTHLHCSFPPFVAEFDVCTLLHCAVKLPLTLTMFNWPQSVYTDSNMQPSCVSFLPRSLKNHAHARTHAPNCRSDMTPFTELFTHTV